MSPDGSVLYLSTNDGASFLRRDTPESRRFLGYWGAEVDVHPDNHRCLRSYRNSFGIVRGTDHGADQLLGTLLTHIDGDRWATISADGHYRGGKFTAIGETLGDGTTPDELAEIEQHLVYVALHDDGSQRTYTPAEFQKTFGWKNDPTRATLLALP